MDTKELIESIITSDEESLDKFVATMEERISDALEVRKVELASGMMSEEELDETTVGRLNSYVNKARNDKSEAEWTAAADHPRDENSYEGEDPERDRLERRAEKRGRGIELARAKMNKSGRSGNTTAKVRAVRDPRAQVKPRIKEEVEQMDEADDKELAQKHKYWKAYAFKTTKKVPGYNAPGRDVYGREYKPKNEEVEQVDESSYHQYSGVIHSNVGNAKHGEEKDEGHHYTLTVPRHRDVNDHLSGKRAYGRVAKENPHLEPHHVKAILQSTGDDKEDVEVEHGGKKYKHRLYNNQDPDYIGEEVEQVDEGRNKGMGAKWRNPPRRAMQAALGRGYGKRGFGGPENPLDDREDKLDSRQFAANITNTKDPKTLAAKYGVRYAKRHGTDLKYMMQQDRNQPADPKPKLPRDLKKNEEVEQDLDEAKFETRAQWRTGTPEVIYKNNKKIYDKMRSKDPEKAERFRLKFLVPKTEEFEQIDEVSAGKYAAVAAARGNEWDADVNYEKSNYNPKKLKDVVRRAGKKFGPKVASQLSTMQGTREKRMDARGARGNDPDRLAKPYPSYDGPRTTKSGMLNKTAGRILKKQIRDRLNKEEVEQIDEAGIGDMEKLRLMGDKNRALTMMAMKRYQQVGDINKLSPAHRTLVTRYMQNQAGSLERVSTGMQRAALRPTKD